MKRNRVLISGAAILGLTLGLQSAVCAADSFSFETQNRKITINTVVDDVEQSFANVLVLPKNFDRNSLSADNWTDDSIVHKMVYTIGGTVSDDVILESDFKSGEYTLYVECGSFKDKSAFMVTDASLSSAVSLVNSGKVLTEVSFGADADIFSANKDVINLLLKNAKPSNGYNTQTFADSYMQISGIVSLMNDKITFDDFVDLYEPYFGNTLDFVADMTSAEKSAYTSAVKIYDIKNCTSSEVVSGARFVTECKMTEDKYKLADVIMAYVKENKLSLGDYEKLNTYYEPKVMGELKNSLENLNSAEKIYDKFLEICDEFYDKQSDENSSGGSGGGGSSSGRGSGGGVSLPTSQPSQTIDNTTATFSDIKGHWSEIYVKKCVETGIINGYTDNTFRPDAKITRAETASLISKLFALKTSDTDSFADVKSEDWFRACVSAAYGAGIVNGYDDGNFRPQSNITRQDMAVMLIRGLEKDNIFLQGAMTFDDEALIADYAKVSVGKLASNGIITGYNNMFRPVDELTRAEAAALICRIMNVRFGGAY